MTIKKAGSRLPICTTIFSHHRKDRNQKLLMFLSNLSTPVRYSKRCFSWLAEPLKSAKSTIVLGSPGSSFIQPGLYGWLPHKSKLLFLLLLPSFTQILWESKVQAQTTVIFARLLKMSVISMHTINHSGLEVNYVSSSCCTTHACQGSFGYVQRI